MFSFGSKRERGMAEKVHTLAHAMAYAERTLGRQSVIGFLEKHPMVRGLARDRSAILGPSWSFRMEDDDLRNFRFELILPGEGEPDFDASLNVHGNEEYAHFFCRASLPDLRYIVSAKDGPLRAATPKAKKLAREFVRTYRAMDTSRLR